MFRSAGSAWTSWIIFAPALILIALAGCHQPKKAVVQASHQIDRRADEIIQAADGGLAGESRRAGTAFRTIKTKAGEIKGLTRGVRETMPALEAKQTRADKLIRLAVWAAVIGFGVLLLFFGLHKPVRALMTALGLGISRLTKVEAKFDAESLDRAPPEQRERIAARRAADPAYDRHFRIEHERIKESKPCPS